MLTAPHAMRNEHLSLWSILEAEGKTEGCEVLFAGSLEGVTPSRDENWDLYLELGKVDFLGVGEKVEMYVPMGRVSDRVKGFPFVNKRFDSQRDLPIYEEMFKPIGVNVVATY